MIFQSIKYQTYALFTGLALVCSGCHHSDELCPPDGSESSINSQEMLTLCLQVSMEGDAPLTRAEDDDTEENKDNNAPNRPYADPTGDFEKISTLRVIIVRNYQETEDEETGAIISSTGIVEANRLVMTNDLGHPLHDNLEFRVIANEMKRIYLVANEKFIPYISDKYDTSTKFLDSFKAPNKGEDGETTNLLPLSAWTVSVPKLTPEMTEIVGYQNGIFSPSSSTRLPLTEYFDLEVTRTDEVDDQFYSHLFLTRAAAKAMFYLNTSDNFDGNNYQNTYIQAISLSGVGTTEYVFPNKTEYSPSKTALIEYTTNDRPASSPKAYIKTFETPKTNREITYLINDLGIEIKKPTDGKARQITTNPIYFPESILESGKNYIVGVQLNTGKWLYAPLQPQKNNDGEQINYYNILNIKKDDTEHQAIARNTYLPIELYFDAAANFTVRVLPWDRKDYYVDYTANVGITDDHCLAFTGTAGQTGDYLLLDEKTAQLVLNYGKVAKGSFTIDSPLGNVWDAYLITTGGTTDAIQFQIPDPDDNTKTITTTHISGKIGEKAEFGIVSTVAPGSEQNSAQLIVMATLATGTQVIVDVLKNWGEGNPGILTVIQNPI